jgi:hypothetical protein
MLFLRMPNRQALAEGVPSPLRRMAICRPLRNTVRAKFHPVAVKEVISERVQSLKSISAQQPGCATCPAPIVEQAANSLALPLDT